MRINDFMNEYNDKKIFTQQTPQINQNTYSTQKKSDQTSDYLHTGSNTGFKYFNPDPKIT